MNSRTPRKTTRLLLLLTLDQVLGDYLDALDAQTPSNSVFGRYCSRRDRLFDGLGQLRLVHTVTDYLAARYVISGRGLTPRVSDTTLYGDLEFLTQAIRHAGGEPAWEVPRLGPALQGRNVLEYAWRLRRDRLEESDAMGRSRRRSAGRLRVVRAKRESRGGGTSSGR